MGWAESKAGALETCRSDDGFRDAAMRGVPGAVGVGVEGPDCAGAVGLGVLKVEVEAVAWWVEWRYGERDWTALVWEEERGPSFVETLLIVSLSSSALSTVLESSVVADPGTLFCGMVARENPTLPPQRLNVSARRRASLLSNGIGLAPSKFDLPMSAYNLLTAGTEDNDGLVNQAAPNRLDGVCCELMVSLANIDVDDALTRAEQSHASMLVKRYEHIARY